MEGGRRSRLARPRARAIPGTSTAGRERRRRLTSRALPLLALGLCAFAVGAIAGASGGDPESRVVDRFVAAWERGDHAAMYALVDDRTRARTPITRFARTYRRAAETATATALAAGPIGDEQGGAVPVPVRIRTRVFGTLRLRASIPISGSGEAARVAWRPELAFPGLEAGERLIRRTSLPDRADILARDGRPLAEGPDRTSPLGPVAREIVGSLGRPPREQRAALRAAGVPSDADVGTSGLERALQDRLAGTPGGVLRAGDRVIARREPRSAPAVKTTIDPGIEAAAIQALAGRFGGVAVLRPRTGAILGLAGVAFSAPQPPGSTFKVITTAAALEAGLVKPSTPFPVETGIEIEGVRLENANGEACGGTFAQSFAHSCNSVFAPLGARLGARRLVAAAERFGFNDPPLLAGAAESTIPPAAEIGDDLAVGSSAIGQGRVQATALHMASVAATIAREGRRVRPTLLPPEGGRAVKSPRAVPARVARTLERLMLGVVREGTGVGAAIPGVQVAGKTGTAELEDKPDEPPPGEKATTEPDDTADTDAWFIAYAPARRPRVAVAVLLVRAGAGGDTAAPAARQVLIAALRGGNAPSVPTTPTTQTVPPG